MDLRNKKILETGADGFICSHLTEKLVEKGYRVKVFVFCNAFNSWGRLDHSPRQIRDNLEIFAGDIRDPFGLDNAASDFNVIFHIAALIAPPYSYDAQTTYVDTNTNSSLNILQATQSIRILNFK